jgi:hypothetical protein
MVPGRVNDFTPARRDTAPPGVLQPPGDTSAQPDDRAGGEQIYAGRGGGAPPARHGLQVAADRADMAR